MTFFSKPKLVGTFFKTLILVAFATAMLVGNPKPALAQSCNFCTTISIPFAGSFCVCIPGGSHGGACGCNASYKNACPIIPPTPDCMGSTVGQVIGAPIHITLGVMHVLLRDLYIKEVFVKQFEDFRNWFAKSFFDKYVRQSLKIMSTNMSASAMQQAFIVGTFYDAKQHLEVQRLFQELENEAIRDYTPSTGICAIGTSVKALQASEERARFNSLSLNVASLSRHLGKTGTAGSGSVNMDKVTRWEKFKTTYCDPQDNGWERNRDENGEIIPAGLVLACGEDGGSDPKRINVDIDYGRLIDQRRTLDIAMDDPYGSIPPDREDVLALGKNLYGHNALSRVMKASYLRDTSYQPLIMDIRAVAARRNVAENSYNAIVELKSSGGTSYTSPASNREYLAAILSELGVPDSEMTDYIGENPSYYAQLEILAKKLYQNPQFYVDLYDKPVNVERKSVALKAIELMLDRAIYESEIRQEMVTSILLSTQQDEELREIREELMKDGGG